MSIVQWTCSGIRYKSTFDHWKYELCWHRLSPFRIRALKDRINNAKTYTTRSIESVQITRQMRLFLTRDERKQELKFTVVQFVVWRNGKVYSIIDGKLSAIAVTLTVYVVDQTLAAEWNCFKYSIVDLNETNSLITNVTHFFCAICMSLLKVVCITRFTQKL